MGQASPWQWLPLNLKGVGVAVWQKIPNCTRMTALKVYAIIVTKDVGKGENYVEYKT